MSPERWQQIKTILDAAAGHSPGGRHAAVEQACSEDSALLREVESFLELDAEVENFIEEPLWTLNPAAEAKPAKSIEWATGRRIGPYRIERPLGHGGMGTVFLACREDAYQQKVAVKVLSWGMSSEEVQARFYNERQILANLQHPGIARLLDGGTTDDGLPYLVMEYVEGERIDRYCERHQLSIRQRLGLFREVCAAVHFAHQNLIVHRDLKASNILVTEEGKPRLLDFGIAKLLEPQLAFQTVATVPGRSPMTPAYASPEQVLNDTITTACDVYALGILLYRLLTGLPPYRLKGTGYAEMVQVICYHEPEKPSTMIRLDEAQLEKQTTEAAVPSPEAATAKPPDSRNLLRGLRRRIAGDLDAIVLKAMRKEPRHRYGSAAEMAEDIRRHLVGLPVAARKGNWVYHTTKFMRRNKLALLVMLMIVAFAVTTTVLWREAVDERNRATRVIAFLEELFSAANPDENQGGDVTVREILERGRQQIVSDELVAEPEAHADLLGTLGTVYNNLGLFEEAEELKEEALRVRRAADKRDSLELAIDINNRAKLRYDLGDYEGAERQWREALDMYRRLDLEGSDDAIVARFNLASALAGQGRYPEAKDLHIRILEMRRAIYGPASWQVASSLSALGAVYSELGDFGRAEPLLREALAIRTQAEPPQNSRIADVHNSLGRMFHAHGNLEAARVSFEEALAIRRRLFESDDPRVATSEKNLAALLLDQGETKAAGELLERALTKLRSSRPEGDFAIVDAESVLGAYLTAEGHYREAEGYLIEGFHKLRELERAETISVRAARARIVDLYERWGRPEKAAEYRDLPSMQKK